MGVGRPGQPKTPGQGAGQLSHPASGKPQVRNGGTGTRPVDISSYSTVSERASEPLSPTVPQTQHAKRSEVIVNSFLVFKSRNQSNSRASTQKRKLTLTSDESRA